MEVLLGFSVAYNVAGLFLMFLTSGKLKKFFIKLWVINLAFGILLATLFVLQDGT